VPIFFSSLRIEVKFANPSICSDIIVLRGNSKGQFLCAWERLIIFLWRNKGNSGLFSDFETDFEKTDKGFKVLRNMVKCPDVII